MWFHPLIGIYYEFKWGDRAIGIVVLRWNCLWLNSERSCHDHLHCLCDGVMRKFFHSVSSAWRGIAVLLNKDPQKFS
ncbi:hypothetical protein V6N13_134940 [Hibiscus sabdariffa]